ncbi:hypothetical protein CASFOL_041520 [Castilleja foliolosa]|uniref:Uncharacterized protein n=1 Tax=Castilleja foliolosa TaxID=1961234 RepID=A0ABD3BB63_9LAMI
MSNVYSPVLVLGLLFLVTPLLARSVKEDLISFGEDDHLSEADTDIWIFNFPKNNYDNLESHDHPDDTQYASGPHGSIHHHHGRHHHHHHHHGGHHAQAPEQAASPISD